jgi:hypothetical protein
VTINQYRVGTDPNAAEEAELRAARDKAQADAQERELASLLARLSTASGVAEDDIVVDRGHKHAIAHAAPIDGAGLGVYRAMEARVSAATPGWNIEIRPPLLPLPSVAINDGEPDGRAVALVAWAAKRTSVAIRLSGSESDRAKVKAALEAAGLRDIAEADGNGGAVEVRWSTGG